MVGRLKGYSCQKVNNIDYELRMSQNRVRIRVEVRSGQVTIRVISFSRRRVLKVDDRLCSRIGRRPLYLKLHPIRRILLQRSRATLLHTYNVINQSEGGRKRRMVAYLPHLSSCAKSSLEKTSHQKKSSLIQFNQCFCVK